MDFRLKEQVKAAIKEIKSRRKVTAAVLAQECGVTENVFNNIMRPGANVKPENTQVFSEFFSKYGYAEIANKILSDNAHRESSFFDFLSVHESNNAYFDPIAGSYLGIRPNAYGDSYLTYKLDVKNLIEPKFNCETVYESRIYQIVGDIFSLKNNYLFAGNVIEESSMHMYILNKWVFDNKVVALYGTHAQTTLDGSSNISVPCIFIRQNSAEQRDSAYKRITPTGDKNEIIKDISEINDKGHLDVFAKKVISFLSAHQGAITSNKILEIIRG